MLFTQGNLMRKRRDFGMKCFIWQAVYPKMKWWYLLNGHIGSSNVGYNGTHGGFWYGSRNADGSRILQMGMG